MPTAPYEREKEISLLLPLLACFYIKIIFADIIMVGFRVHGHILYIKSLPAVKVKNNRLGG